MKLEASEDFIMSYFIKELVLEKTNKPRFDESFSEDKPSWFINKSLSGYEIYTSKDNDFNLLIDQSTKEIYIYSIQF